jgi:hypothetical protein
MRYEESLKLLRPLRDRKGIAECLEGLARIEGAQGDPNRAACLLGAAEGLRDACGAPIPLSDREALKAVIMSVEAAIGKQVYEQEISRGQSMAVDAAIDYAIRNEP